MKEGEIINENEIVLPVFGSHVVAAGIGGKEKNMYERMICMNCKNYENGKCMVKYYVQETSPYHECDEVMLSADFEPDGKPVMFYEERKED